MTTESTPDVVRLHAELGALTRRALDLDVQSARGDEASDTAAEALWRQVADLALEFCDRVTSLGQRLDTVDAGTKRLEATVVVAEKDLRDRLACLRGVMGGYPDEVVDACRTTRDGLVRLGLALEDVVGGRRAAQAAGRRSECSSTSRIVARAWFWS